MNVLYICGDPGVPIFGRKGCSIHVQEVARALKNAGATVQFLAARVGNCAPDDLADCIVHELPIARSDSIRDRERAQIAWNERCTKLLNQLATADLIYERYSIWNAAGMLWGRKQQIPSVLEVNAPLIDEQKQHRGLCNGADAMEFTRRAMGAADTVYTVSEEIVPYCQRFVDSRTTVHVIPNGVNTDRFSPFVAAADPSPRLTFGFVGSLKPWHGVELLLSAFSKLRRYRDSANRIGRTLPETRLIIVGDGPQMHNLRRTIDEQPDLRSSVELIGAVDAADVPKWLNSIDVAVAPYPKLDGFYFSPLKLYEYMASGRAIIAAATGQIRDVIEHAKTGYLYPAGDVNHLAAAMIELMLDKSLRDLLAGNAYRASAQNSWESVVARILSLSRPELVDAESR